jgi:carbon storage regulator
MLILARKVAQTLVIPGRDVTIQVLRIVGNRVKLGISARRDVRVVRREIAPGERMPLSTGSDEIAPA